MKEITVAEVIEAIDALAAREPGGAIAFDGDGTLWDGDIGEDFFHALLDHGIDPSLHDALVREAAAERLLTAGTPVEIARRIHAAYLGGAFSEARVCEVMTWVAGGMTKKALEAFCAALMSALDLPRRLHGEALAVVEHARRVGIDVYVVSASPRAIVEEGARLCGIDRSMVIAVTEARDANGVVLPTVVRPIPYQEGKASLLRQRLGAHALYAAFGDNAFDVPMLASARIPIAIRPKTRLIERAGDVPELARLQPI